jgi:hypothetical protein
MAQDDEQKGRIVVLVVAIVFISFILYDIAISIYEKYWLDYDRHRLERICGAPNMYSCDDLDYAAPYCAPARIEGDKRCGRNFSVISMP